MDQYSFYGFNEEKLTRHTKVTKSEKLWTGWVGLQGLINFSGILGSLIFELLVLDYELVILGHG